MVHCHGTPLKEGDAGASERFSDFQVNLSMSKILLLDDAAYQNATPASKMRDIHWVTMPE